MSGKYIIDTNFIIALFNNEKRVIDFVDNISQTYIPSTVIGELYFGAYKSGNVEFNIRKIDDLCLESNILHTDEYVAKVYGEIKSELKKKGKPIPENDIWIAAFAKFYKMILVTRDSHFKDIEGIKLENF
jgi:tRNA(fMet)-specific endonuclease VapC